MCVCACVFYKVGIFGERQKENGGGGGRWQKKGPKARKVKKKKRKGKETTERKGERVPANIICPQQWLPDRQSVRSMV